MEYGTGFWAGVRFGIHFLKPIKWFGVAALITGYLIYKIPISGKLNYKLYSGSSHLHFLFVSVSSEEAKAKSSTFIQAECPLVYDLFLLRVSTPRANARRSQVEVKLYPQQYIHILYELTLGWSECVHG